ncbi:MAG TPA: hypothetical protein DCS91_00065 [Microcoleaceae bacterium UBA11344]|jgi:hypothetical protein|nr:hypothetical protein [Microcoleaceae cyanobacterium UBA11344]
MLQLNPPQPLSNVIANPIAQFTANPIFQSSKSWLTVGIVLLAGLIGYQYWLLTRWNLDLDTD